MSIGSELNNIQLYFTRYFMIPIYIFGNFGNSMNIILFLQTNLKVNNTCAWYFISLSVANLLLIDIGGLSRTLPFVVTKFTLETTSIVFCKWRYYMAHFLLLLGRYFLCLIAIDRWMVTSSYESIRRLSSLRTARILIFGGTTLVALFSIHAAIGYEIQNNRCYARFTAAYEVFFNIYNVLSIVIPIGMMTLINLLIITNIRQSRHRIQTTSDVGTSSHHPSTRTHQPKRMKFIRLALIQSFVFLLLNVGYAIYVIYDFVTSSQVKSPDRQAIEGFLYAFSIHLVYIFSSLTFATYTLASSIFRKECVSMSHHLWRKILQCCEQ